MLSSPDASDEAKAAARDALARLDALAAADPRRRGHVRRGHADGGERGHGRPGRGQAPVLPAALVGLGALLLGVAVAPAAPPA